MWNSLCILTVTHLKTSTLNMTYQGANCDGKSFYRNTRWILYTSMVRTIVSCTLCPVFQKGSSLVKKWVTQLHLLHMKHGDTPLALCFSITTDQSMLESIKASYLSDDFCLCLAQSDVPGAHLVNSLWYIRDCLIIPRTGDICENLFWLTHDTLGHFSADKS